MSFDRVRFTTDLGKEVRSSIEPHLKRFAFLIPAWCREVNIVWDDRDDKGALSTDVHYEYRSADLIVLPNFLSIPEIDRRERDVIHELLHIVAAPLAKAAQDLRDALVKAQPDTETIADEMIRQAMESVICDLTTLVYDRLAVKR